MKTGQSFADFQTGTGAAVHATLGTEQLISNTIPAIVDTTASLQESERGIFPVSELHELLN